MQAALPRLRSFPVVHPERVVHRRVVRRRSLVRAVAVTALIMLPAVLLVSQRTHAAKTGYAILTLRQEIEALQADNARLLATVTALKSPDRIERIATSELGMVTPRQQQLATLTITSVAAQEAPRQSLWDRFGSWLRSEAEASESPRQSQDFVFRK